MTTRIIKTSLEEMDYKKLEQIAKESGFEGRGKWKDFLECIARNNIIILNSNSKKALKLKIDIIQ